MQNQSIQPMNHQPQNQESNERVKDTIVKVLAILGLIALLSFGTYLVVRYVPKAIHGLSRGATSVSSKLSGTSKKLSLATSKSSVDSGEAFALSWINKDTTDGVYSLSYPCEAGVHLEAIRNSTTEVIFCDRPYDFQNSGNAITLEGISTTQAFVDLPITLSFEKADKSVNSSAVSVTIANQMPVASQSTSIVTPPHTSPTTNVSPKPTPLPTPAPTPKPTPIASPAPIATPTAGTPQTHTYNIPSTGSSVSNATGTIDLTGRVLATGFINISNNVFVSAPQIKLSDRGAVKFEVINSGSKASGVWKFVAMLPTYPAYTFESDTQISLNPGDRVEFVLGFDGVAPQNSNTIAIRIDPQNFVMESNESNNALAQIMYVNLNQ